MKTLIGLRDTLIRLDLAYPMDTIKAYIAEVKLGEKLERKYGHRAD